MKASKYFANGTANLFFNNYTAALEDFNMAIKKDPEFAEAYYNRGMAKYALGYATEACEDWKKAKMLGCSSTTWEEWEKKEGLI